MPTAAMDGRSTGRGLRGLCEGPDEVLLQLPRAGDWHSSCAGGGEAVQMPGKCTRVSAALHRRYIGGKGHRSNTIAGSPLYATQL